MRRAEGDGAGLKPRVVALRSGLAAGTGPTCRCRSWGAARMAATSLRVPAPFGGVASSLGAAPAALGQSERRQGGRAGCGRHVGVLPAGLPRVRRSEPDRSHLPPPPLSRGVTWRSPSECSALGQSQNCWGFFVKGRLSFSYTLWMLALLQTRLGPGTQTQPPRLGCGVRVGGRSGNEVNG